MPINLEKRDKIIIIAVGLLSAVLIGAVAVNAYMVESDTNSFEAEATVESPENSTLGVVSEPNLRFGEVPEGATVRKKLNLTVGQTTMFKIDSRGNISEMLEYEKVKLVEEGETSIEVAFEADRQGYYNGDLQVKHHVSTKPGGERWLKLRSLLGY